MEKKTVKKLSDLVADVLFKNCCNGKLCYNCKYDTPNFDCHISAIIKLIKEYEEMYIN